MDANPLTDTTIRWRRPEPGYDMKSKTKTQLGQPGLEQTLGTTELPGQSGAKTVNTHLPSLKTEVKQ